MKFPLYRQSEQMDCGIACLRMISAYYGKFLSSSELRDLIRKGKDGVSINDIYQAAEKIGLRSRALALGVESLKNDIPLPCILHWEDQHFTVLYKIRRGKFYVADPSYGFNILVQSDFEKAWCLKEPMNGIALILEPGNEFEKGKSQSDLKGLSSSKLVATYLKKHLSFIYQLVVALLFVSLIQLCFPFITQSIVDHGIQLRDLSFIKLLLLAQIFLFLGRTSIEAIRAWIILHMSSRINIQMLTDYFIKLMRLPLSFFDSRMTGDILQRVNDHKRIERLLTNGSLSFLFSIFNLFIFGVVLFTYDYRIFLLYTAGSILYLSWILLFMKERKKIDYQRFGKMGEDQSKIIEMINGMHEIKLNNAERNKRWDWEANQISLYQISIKSLKLEQMQSVVGNFINEFKNILLSFLSAYLVVKEEISLGMMLAISYILGQLNAPLSQLIGFSYTFQDAKIAFERLKEIYALKDEGDEVQCKLKNAEQIELSIENLSFSYPSTNQSCLKDICLQIPAKKTTAIVGKSGSGKSTLLKLILQFYSADSGRLRVNGQDLEKIDKHQWRSVCGVVMQDGYIFNDSIEQNIIMNSHGSEKEDLDQILEISNLKEWLSSLPLGLQTQIGIEGVGLSGGQKQRILIARALYKNPKLILLDEATSSLDAANEREINQKLLAFFEQKTVIIIAHRLSTIRNADQIIMMEDGRVAEIGTHDQLLLNRGPYSKLVDKQLESRINNRKLSKRLSYERE